MLVTGVWTTVTTAVRFNIIQGVAFHYCYWLVDHWKLTWNFLCPVSYYGQSAIVRSQLLCPVSYCAQSATICSQLLCPVIKYQKPRMKMYVSSTGLSKKNSIIAYNMSISINKETIPWCTCTTLDTISKCYNLLYIGSLLTSVHLRKLGQISFSCNLQILVLFSISCWNLFKNIISIIYIYHSND